MLLERFSFCQELSAAVFRQPFNFVGNLVWSSVIVTKRGWWRCYGFISQSLARHSLQLAFVYDRVKVYKCCNSFSSGFSKPLACADNCLVVHWGSKYQMFKVPCENTAMKTFPTPNELHEISGTNEILASIKVSHRSLVYPSPKSLMHCTMQCR